MQVEVEKLEELGAGEALQAFGRLRAERDRASRDIFVLAAHFADLYNVHATPRGLRRKGGERPIQVAGDGAPLVLEFAIAELAAELHLTTWSAKRLIGDALETRHRLPRLWQRVYDGEVADWIAAKVARATRNLTAEQAAIVDAEIAEYADSRLPYWRFAELLAAKVIQADPEGAATRERAAAEQRFAKVGQSNEHGQKTLYIKTSAAEMARIDASISYLAEALKTLGDPDPQDLRRTKAVLILANPAQALALMQALATHNSRSEPPAPGAPGPGGGEASDCPTTDEHADGAPARQAHPQPAPDPESDPEPAGPVNAAAGGDEQAGTASSPDETSTTPVRPDSGSPRPPAAGPPDPSPPDPMHDGEPAEGEPAHGDPPDDSSADGAPPDPIAPFIKPFHPAGVPLCSCRGGTLPFTWASLLPRVNLYLHVHADSIDAGHGVVRWEGEGPVSLYYIREFLGPDAEFTVKPVIDTAKLAPVDAYEIPERHREALHLRTPADIFPFAPNTGRKKHADHTKAYCPHDKGGPPGQTGLHNLGPMIGYHHRVKTHAGWKVEQPFPGIYVWMSPHGSLFLVDHTGTRQLRGPHTDSPTRPRQQPPRPRISPRLPDESPLEERLALLVEQAA